MKKTLFVIVLLVFSAVLFAEVVPTLELGGSGNYSYLPMDKTKKNFSYGGQANLASAVMFNFDFAPWMWIVPSVTADYSSTGQPLTIDEEKYLFQQWIDVYASLGPTFDIIANNWEFKAKYFFRKDFSQQTKDEPVGKGLYDFMDNGFYIENVNRFDFYSMPTEFTLGFRYVDRRFPNYKSLIGNQDLPGVDGYAADPNAATKEKDSLSYRLYTNMDFRWEKDSGGFTNISVNYDYVPYFEQKVIDADGTTLPTKRMDHLTAISIDIPYYFSNNTVLAGSYTIAIRETNQNYRDTLGDSDFANDKYIKYYYNNYNHNIGLRFNYELPVKYWSEFAPITSLGLNYEYVLYGTRYAKNIDGFYKSVLQQDNNLGINLGYSHKIFDWWSYNAGISFTEYKSNMDYEAYGVYNYNYWLFNLGTGISF